MDYTLNIVSKCHFFFISKHLRAPKRSWKIFHVVLESPGKVLDFFVSKRVGTLSESGSPRDSHKGKGEGSPIDEMSVGFQRWSRSSAVSPQMTEAINAAEGCHYFLPSLWLPPQPQSITAHLLVPNYTAWWQLVNNLPTVAFGSESARIQTHSLLIGSTAP